VVEQGGDYRDIAVNICGSDSITVSEAGDLQIYVNSNLLTEKAPVAYQDSMGYRLHRSARYLVRNDVVRYEVQNANPNHRLIIDPEMITYFGGEGDDGGSCIDVVNDSILLLCLSTYSVGIIKGDDAYDTTYNGNCDIAVNTINYRTGQVIAQTYYGGTQDDCCKKVFFTDSAVVLLGATESSDVPITRNALDATYNGMTDIIIVIFNIDCDSLLYSTYIGGKGYDELCNAAYDNHEYLYIAGWTTSTDFPTTSDAVYTHYRGGGGDAYCMKVSRQYDTLLYCTYYGGRGYDEGRGISISSNGSIVLCGFTDSEDLPIIGEAIQAKINGPEDGFIVVIDSTERKLKYSSYFGGAESDVLIDVTQTIDAGFVFIGKTVSLDLPVTPGVIQSHRSYTGNDYIDQDLCLLKCNSQMQIEWCSYLGGTSEDEPWDIQADEQNNIAIVGRTYSDDYPIINSYNEHLNNSNGVITIINNDGTRILYSCVFGGDEYDTFHDLSINTYTLAACGTTLSNNIRVSQNAIQKQNNGGQDAIIAVYLLNELIDETDERCKTKYHGKMLACSPNPCRNQLNIHIALRQERNQTITIYDMSGAIRKRIQIAGYNAEMMPVIIDITKMETGVYFVQLLSEDICEICKVLKL
jgi:hypothetical protein